MTRNLRLTTERLVLRSIQPDDAGSLFNYRSDPLANRYQGWIPSTLDDVHDFISLSISPTLNISGTWHQVVMIEKAGRVIIGDIGIHFLDPGNAQVELGFTLGKAYQGKGYATEALATIIDFLFIKLNKRRIVASIDPRNEKSVQLVERLGFRKEAHFRESILVHGEWADDVIYAILKTEWPARGSAPQGGVSG
jgi:RimJ/RimL family protein N-acetyltransferase